jgi:hypothetical protein
MHAMVTQGKSFVLVGSVRDDGPLPDVHTDVIVGQRAMRAELHGVGFAIMVATMLHSIATGNILPASIPLVCVDINPATVTKLADRGSAQAVGIVTDIGLFLEGLARELVPGASRPPERRRPPRRERRWRPSDGAATPADRAAGLLEEGLDALEQLGAVGELAVALPQVTPAGRAAVQDERRAAGGDLDAGHVPAAAAGGRGAADGRELRRSGVVVMRTTMPHSLWLVHSPA